MRRALIIGGGIGGLSAALSLVRCGFQVEVIEQSGAIVESGAGIQLSPNATRVLYDLGLAGALKEEAFLPERTEIRHWRTGRLIASNALGHTCQERYGFPYLHIHRGDLIAVLETAVRNDPRIQLHTGCRVTQFQDNGEHVSVVVNGTVIQADVLIGADGIRSVVRENLFGPERAEFTGNVAWRMLVPLHRMSGVLVPPVAGLWWGPRRHFVHYLVRSGKYVNCVCVVEQGDWTTESWTEHGDLEELRRAFSDWHPMIQALLNAAPVESLFKWALFDRQPMPSWGRGRTTLLGDACHPTLPFMAQGAAMAIEDGAVLAACLATGESISEALMRYAALRRPRTSSVQQGSRRNATIFHLSGIKAWLRNQAAARLSERRLDDLFRYDALSALEE